MRHSNAEIQARIDTVKVRWAGELEHAEKARAVVEIRKKLFLENDVRKKLHEEDRDLAALQRAKFHSNGKKVEDWERLKAQDRREYLAAQENRERDKFENKTLKPLQDDKEAKMLKASRTHKDIRLLEGVLYARSALKPHAHAEHEARLEQHMSAEAKE